MKNALVLVAVTILVASIWSNGAGPQQQGVTASQWTGPNTSTYCSTPTYVDTDMQTSLTTSGNPVSISFNATVNLGVNQGIGLRPTIDSFASDLSTTAHYVSNGDMTTLSFTRIYSVPKGTHLFKVQAACQGDVGINVRWLTVVELK